MIFPDAGHGSPGASRADVGAKRFRRESVWPRANRTVAFALLVVCTTAGCGFELRGWDLESSIESVHVAAKPGVRVGGELRRALSQAGVRIEPLPSAAAMIVELLEERRGRRTVAVTGSARAAEYEVTVSVRFAIRSGARVLREPVWLDASRVFVVDRDNIAGTAGEQALIEAELANDLVGQLMRALNAAAATAAPPPAAASMAPPAPDGALALVAGRDMRRIAPAEGSALVTQVGAVRTTFANRYAVKHKPTRFVNSMRGLMRYAG